MDCLRETTFAVRARESFFAEIQLPIQAKRAPTRIKLGEKNKKYEDSVWTQKKSANRIKLAQSTK
jgi:hypothetical protein